MYTKEDIISERICITGIPDREELRKLQNHFFGHFIKESEPEAARKNINEVFYRFYQMVEYGLQKDGKIDNAFGSMSIDYSSPSVPNQLRASKTIDYNDFTYSYWKYTREEILFRKLYISNIPNATDLFHLAMHMNINLTNSDMYPHLFSKTGVYRFFSLSKNDSYGYIKVAESKEDFLTYGGKKNEIIDYSQFTYGDKYTRDYVRKNNVVIYGAIKEEEYKKLFNHMYSHISESEREPWMAKKYNFNHLTYYRFFGEEPMFPSRHGMMSNGYSKKLIKDYKISTCIPYSAFNYEEDEPLEEVPCLPKKEKPKLSNKWSVEFNKDHCIVNNVKWNNVFMKVMTDLLIRNTFEEMPIFEEDLSKILEYYELYE